MNRMYETVRHFIVSEDGPTAVEYAVVVALLVFAMTVGLGLFATGVNEWFSSAGDNISGMPDDPQ